MTRNGFRFFVSLRSWRGRLGVFLGGLAVLGICGVAKYYWGSPTATAQVAGEPSAGTTAAEAPQLGAIPQAQVPMTRPASSLIPARPTVPDIVAAVDGHSISRDELAAECRAHHGKEVLESMVNKFLILAECGRLGITVTRHEVEQEIEQMARSFNLPVEQWLKMLQAERGIKPDQYANDIIWPSLALRKLAGEKLQVTQKELVEAFDVEYGQAVKARIIVCSTAEEAKKVRELAAANPDEFGNLAKQHSKDAPSASVKGLIQPIRKHGPCPEIETAAFSLADGQISEVISSSGQFVILKRDGLIAARQITMAQAAPRLEKIIRDRKMRAVATEIFQDLQKRTRVQNVYNDPRLQQQVGRDVVALVNDAPIYLRQLDDECLVRHGADVLQVLIGRRILELACKKNQVVVSDQEIDAEIARAAALMARPLKDGSPDVHGWLALVSKQQGISIETYRREVVWPAVALKKLAVGRIEVSEEDLKKGFEANYGPRVRCRAIVLNNLRRAQEVWDAARRNPSVENFGELAGKYSIEGSSRANLGMVPPIRKFGGQPALEEEAFKLKPGELSGLVEVDDKIVILYCEGYTEPIGVTFDSVRKDIADDIREKKERLAMTEYYEHLQDSTRVDNYLDPAASRVPGRDSKGTAGRKSAGPVVPTAYTAPAGGK